MAVRYARRAGAPVASGEKFRPAAARFAEPTMTMMPTRGPAAATPATPTPQPRTILCPYCGHLSLNPHQCEACKGLFDPLSKQASQNSMGPWFIRDAVNPFRPGCSYATLIQLVRRGRIKGDTIIRGPITRQFWAYARNVPSVGNLLGECHACHAPVEAADTSCSRCSASFAPIIDREYLGLAPVHLLPGTATPEAIAEASLATAPARFQPPVLSGAMTGGGAGAFGSPMGQASSASAGTISASDVALARLRRRADRLVTIVWILAAFMAVLVGATVLLVAGPSMGLDVLGGRQPRSATAPAPAAMPAPDVPAAAPASTGAEDALSAPVPRSGDDPPLPRLEAPSVSAGGDGALSSALPDLVTELVATDTDASLRRALEVLSAQRVGGGRGADETATAAAAYIQRRRTSLDLGDRL